MKQIYQHTANQDSREILIRKFRDIDLSNPFFNTFIENYGENFVRWADRKKDDSVYIVEDGREVLAFVKLKIEDKSEDYSDITPVLLPKRRMKLCSFKVTGGPILSTRMMELVISQALFYQVDEIYGTVVMQNPEIHRFVRFLKRFGFERWGVKTSNGLVEDVYVKKMI